MAHNKQPMELFSVADCFKDGYFTPGQKPGHGVDIDEKLASSRACLPVNRLEDGTHCGMGKT